MEIEDAQTEVYAKIGRNMLLYQQLEMLLKFLIARSDISGTASQLKKRMEKRSETTHRKTLGQLAGDYTEEILGPEIEPFAREPENLTEPFVSMTYRFGDNEAYQKDKTEELAELVEQRNDLIHHLLPQLDLTSSKSCEKLGYKLDAQTDVIRIEVKAMQTLVESMKKAYSEIAAYLKTEEGRKALFPEADAES